LTPKRYLSVSFAPISDWSSYYASGKEIQEYIVNTTDKYGLRENIRSDMRLVKAIWNEKQGKWRLHLEQGEFYLKMKLTLCLTEATFSSELFFFSMLEFRDQSNNISQWKWPDIEGLDLFKGKLLHTAQW
jgi:cation diffusion facilitator CzcD-associated flavoprotein CzcO